MSSKHVLALAIGLTLSTAANANEYRQHGAHVHGHVEFNIAQDGKDLLVEITAPGADVVGFEHAPKNAQQEQALKQAVATLEDSNALFAINSQADCNVEEAYVSHNLSETHEEHDHSEHDHDDHAHHDHEGHEHHDHNEHHDKHDHHDDHDEAHDHGGHGEFSVQYRFSCEQVNQLSQIQTDWFNQFPTTESINVNIFTDTMQSAIKLSKDNSQIVIK
ncbi:zinc uptake protein ZrgA [Vibrio alginolyticus]|uniref:zinc uptake protein ZrgA n=1 Tax=Vibrio alginolyticus TaxID=663 RepID=UPI00375464F4